MQIYILKIKGIELSSDSLQIRDENFTLVGYYKISDIKKIMINNDFNYSYAELKKMIVDMPYGKIEKMINNT